MRTTAQWRTRHRQGWWSVAALFGALALGGCKADGGPDIVIDPPPPPVIPPPVIPPPPPPPPATSTVTGVVRSGLTGELLANAQVIIGFKSTTTGSDGRFELREVVVGNTTIGCNAAGFNPYQAPISVTAAGLTHEITMQPKEAWALDGPVRFSIFVPAGVPAIHGAIALFGGPDTRGFTDPEIPMGAPDADGETALRQFADSLKKLAREYGLAILGTDQPGYASGPSSDADIVTALQRGAVASGHPDIASVPILTIGISGGGPEAIGFAHRNASRAIAVVVRVPDKYHNVVMTPADEAFLNVPLLLVTGELDDVVDTPFLREMFYRVRGYGGRWAYAEVPGGLHFTAPAPVWSLMVDWVRTAVQLRLSLNSATPLNVIEEGSGWLGDNLTREITPWAAFPGERPAASWLPSESVAARWQAAVTPP